MADDTTPEPTDEAPEAPKRSTRANRQAIARENRERSVAHVLSTPLGRRFIWAELSEGRAFQLSFAVGDPHLTAFNEGRRDRALKLLVEIMRDHHEAYALMASEARADDAN